MPSRWREPILRHVSRIPRDLSQALTILVCSVALAATATMVVSRFLLPSDGMLIPTDTWPWTTDGVEVRPLTHSSLIRNGDVVVSIDDRPLADWAVDAIRPPWFLAPRAVGPILDVGVRRDGSLVDVAVPVDAAFASRLGGAPLGLVIFGAGALIVALTLVLRRPQATAIRLLFVGVCCNTADIVAWEMGLQPADLVGRTPFLYAFALAAVGNLVFWGCLIHLLSIYPVRAGVLVRRPAAVRLIYAAPLAALAAGAVLVLAPGGSILDWFDRLGTLIALIVSAMVIVILGSIVAGYRRTPAPRRPQVRLLAITLGIAASASLVLTSLPTWCSTIPCWRAAPSPSSRSRSSSPWRWRSSAIGCSRSTCSRRAGAGSSPRGKRSGCGSGASSTTASGPRSPRSA